MKKLVLAALIVSSSAFAQINQQCPQFTVQGTPKYQARAGDQEICHTNYAVIYRCEVKSPIAVFEHLTVSAISGPAKRKNNFRPDVSITPACSATLADYALISKTHDRGHMSPAGNNTQNDVIMSESFNLSNIVAQNANNNRGAWRLLEIVERQLARAPGTDYYIISGGIWDQGHRKIGSGLGIPTRLYKIIYEKNSKKVRAYLMPNAAVTPATNWSAYETTVAAVEQAAGLTFALPK